MFMSSNPTLAGGVQEHILHLSKQLRENGHSVTIFGPKPAKNRFAQYKAMGEKVYFPLPNGTQSNVHILGTTDLPETVFTQKKFDIVHIHEPYIPFAAWTVLEKSTIPIVGTFHTAWDNESFFNIFNSFVPLFKDRFSSFTDGAIFVSKITFEKWKPMCNKSVLKNIIPNAVDTSLFEPKKSINKMIHLLFAARLVQRKGLYQLLKALVILKNKGYRFILTVMGDGDEKNQDLNFIKNNKLQTYIRYMGEIKGAERSKYFKEADVFCAPYVNEAASISVLEAVSSGLVIAGYNIPIFSDLLKDYPGKELLTQKTDIALARALEKIMRDTDIIHKIKKWCIKKRETFSWITVAKQTETHYYQVLKKYEKKNS